MLREWEPLVLHATTKTARTRRRRVHAVGQAQQKEAGGDGQSGTASSAQKHKHQPEELITEQEKEEETLLGSSHRSRDGDLITAGQSRRCTGRPPRWPALPQYLRLSAWDAVLVPKSHLREPLLGGRTTQSLAADPRRPPAGELLPSEPGVPARRQVCPGSPHPPAAAGGTLSVGRLRPAGIMHLARGFPFERALQLFN